MNKHDAPAHPQESSTFVTPPHEPISRRAAIATFIGASLTGWSLVLGIGTLL